jgi:UDP-N-acetylglucosamine 3-dehydrogenase
MPNLAIIGFEHVHAAHYLAALKQLPEVKLFVAEKEAQRLTPYKSQLEGVPVFSDFRRLLEEVSLDGAIVCTDNAGHRDAVNQCARSHVHILCEKPIATSLEDARQMLALCEANQVILGICFPVRQSPVLAQAREVIRQGGMGKIRAIKATNHGTMPGDWFADPIRSGGGAIMDHTVHVADALRWLLDAEFTRVFALSAIRLYDIPVEDCGLLSLEMNNGVFVTLDTSWSRPNRSFPLWGDVTLRVIGEKGVLDLDLFPWTLNYFSEEAEKHLAIAGDGDLNYKMLINFLEATHGNGTVSATGRDGLRALEVVMAAYRSVSSGQPVHI